MAASDGARVVDGCSVSGWAGARCIARPSARPSGRRVLTRIKDDDRDTGTRRRPVVASAQWPFFPRWSLLD